MLYGNPGAAAKSLRWWKEKGVEGIVFYDAMPDFYRAPVASFPVATRAGNLLFISGRAGIGRDSGLPLSGYGELGRKPAPALGLLPFLPGDLVKIALAAAVLPLAWKLIPWRS